MQCIVVKSNEFENLYSLLYILLKPCIGCCSLRSNDRQQLLSLSLSLLLSQFAYTEVSSLTDVTIRLHTKLIHQCSKQPAKQAFPRCFGAKAARKIFLPLVSFLARSKPRISFLGLSLLRNSTETLATQAMQ